MPDEKQSRPGAQPGFWSVVVSVLASFFGVQSSRNRERDFTQGRPSAYIFVGVMLTAVFVLTVFGVVRLVLHLAGV